MTPTTVDSAAAHPTHSGACKLLFCHDKPDWLLLAILVEAERLGFDAAVIGSPQYQGFGACRESFTPEVLLARSPLATQRLARFRRAYRHLSVNPEPYERFCYERWFLIAALLETTDTLWIYLDSDYLPLQGFDLSKLPQGPLLDSPFMNVLRSRAVFTAFLDFLIEVFESDAAERLAVQYMHQGKPHLSDMFVLREFSLAHPAECLFVMNTLIQRGLCANVHVHQGYTHAHGWRNLYHHALEDAWYSQRTDGSLERFYSLHFQGPSKRYAPRFLHPGTMDAEFAGKPLWALYRERHGEPPTGFPGE